MGKAEKRVTYAVKLFVLTLCTVILIFPFFTLIMTSLKSFADIRDISSSYFPVHWSFEPYTYVFTEYDFLGYSFNSLHIAFFTVVGTVLSSSLVAFAFARFKVRESRPIFSILMISVMIPGQVLQISMYELYNSLNLIDSFIVFWVPPFLGGGIMNVFMILQFFRGLPSSLFDAAKIDGANAFRQYWQIAVPLSKPVLIVIAIFTFTGSWNDFMTPMIYLRSSEKYTLQLAMFTMFDQLRIGGLKPWNVIAAGNIVTMIPIIAIYFCVQKYFTEGIALSGMKL